MTHSRNKGAAFERTIARLFRSWLGDEWSVRRLQPSQQAEIGDLEILGPYRFPFAVELKARESFREHQLWTGTGQVDDWWEQAQRQAVGRHPLLVLKRNLGPVLCMMPRACAAKLGAPTRSMLIGEVSVWLLDDLLAVPPSMLWELT